MRHTLLPISERNALRRDYFIRLVIVFCFLSSVSLLIGLAGLFPAYLHVVDLEKTELNIANALQKSKEGQDRAAIENRLRSDAKIAARLAQDLNRPRASKSIESLIAVRNSIAITSINFSIQGTSTATLSIEGMSPTRDELLSFKTRLQNSFKDSKVDLPISELAKSKDINFKLKVTYKIQ